MKINEATILVVDDEPELREIFAAWLSRNGCEVLTAANGVEALSILTSQAIDAMISDIRMPLMDGITLVRRMAELGLRIPSIIFVSGFGDIAAREAHALGVEAMISKPIAREQLLGALRNCLSLREELWLTPPAGGPDSTVAANFPSLRQAVADRALQFGRGGFCIRHAKHPPEGTVGFAIHMDDEGIDLNGRGWVRWAAAQQGCVGIEFVYIEPESRGWLIPLLTDPKNFSFIPHC